MYTKSLKIGAFTTDSRIVMPPMATHKSTEPEGHVVPEQLDYYKSRAKNPHIGLIITEHCHVTLAGKSKEKQLSIKNDHDIDGLKQLAESIHEGGAKAIAQLSHAGAATYESVVGGKKLAPSAIVPPLNPMMGDGLIPSEISQDEIHYTVDAFAAAAIRAQKAGYDGVEIHSAHAYLLNEFYSPLTNHRTDDYGGSLENRLRIHREIITAVRAAVGSNYTVAVRLGACDYMDGGSTISDAVYAAKLFEELGIDLIDISGGMCRYNRPGHTEPGFFKDSSSAIKQAVNIPVLTTGGVRTLEQANALLAENAADLIGVGRPLLQSADWEMA